MSRYFKGFTLMELMIVMAVIAIASAVILPRLVNNEGKLYRVQLRTLTSALNYNRRSAIVMNQPFEMTIFPVVDSKKTEANIKTVTKGDWVSQGADVQWQSGKKIVKNHQFNIQYFPQGGATGGVITLQQGRFVAHLTIDGITGKVTIKESLDDLNN